MAQLVQNIRAGRLESHDSAVRDVDGVRRTVYYYEMNNGWLSVITIPIEIILQDGWDSTVVLLAVLCVLLALVGMGFLIRGALDDRRLIHGLRPGQVQFFQQGLHGGAVLRHIGQAAAIVAEQHGAVHIQDQRERQVEPGVLGRAVAVLFRFTQDLPGFQAVGCQPAAALGDVQKVVQNAVRIAQQRVRQRAGADAAGQLVGAGAHDQRKPAAVQAAVGAGVALRKGARDRVAEVVHEHKHQRRLGGQQVPEAVLGAVGGIVAEKGQFIPRRNTTGHTLHLPVQRPCIFCVRPKQPGGPQARPAVSVLQKPRNSRLRQIKTYCMSRWVPCWRFRTPFFRAPRKGGAGGLRSGVRRRAP